MAESQSNPDARLMTLQGLLGAYVFCLLAGISIVAVYYELRRKRFEPTPSKDRIFRCERCGFVYTDDADVDRSRCPQCGTSNDMINF